jgi:hypothetical protein
MTRSPDPPSGVPDPQAQLLRLTYGALAAQVVYVAAKLGLVQSQATFSGKARWGSWGQP